MADHRQIQIERQLQELAKQDQQLKALVSGLLALEQRVAVLEAMKHGNRPRQTSRRD